MENTYKRQYIINNTKKINNENKLLKKYIHDIRNIRILNKEMLNDIDIMTHEEKMCIIITLNDVIDSIKYFIED